MDARDIDSRRDRIEALFDAHERHVRGYARRRLTGAEDVEDVVAETFAIAWRRIEELPPEPLPWLYGTARRVIAYPRRATRRRGALVDAVTTDASLTRGEPSDPGVFAALAALGEADREALLLVAWEGLTHRQAARVAGCSLAAFAARHRRARRRLAQALWGESEPPASLRPTVLDEPREGAS